MKWFAPFLVLIALTDPQGIRVWIVKEQITTVIPPASCDERAHARVHTGDTFLCVRETVEQVIEKIR